MRTIFVFAYYSYKDPVFQSAVLPYLKMSQNSQLRFVLLTWEQKWYKLSRIEFREIKNELAKQNIIWKTTNWNSGKFKIFKKAFDFTKGVLLSFYYIKKFKVDKIYSEGFPGAVIGHYLSKITNTKHIVHTFEPHADYMRDAGVWTERSWEYLFLKKMELRIARHAQYIVTATESYKQILMQKGAKDNIVIMPSCIDTNIYKFMPKERRALRSTLGLTDDTIVIAYLGKIGGMYMEDDLYWFIKHVMGFKSLDIQFHLLTSNDKKSIVRALKKINAPVEKVMVRYLCKDDVPRYLSVADIAFCGIRPIPSRRYSSPIKNGEYWSCGLPVLMPSGISDDYINNTELKIGYTFNKLSDISPIHIADLKNMDRKLIEQKGHKLRGLNMFKGDFERIFNL